MAMNEPMAAAVSGATHQKRGLRNTFRTPRHCELQPGVCADGAMSGTKRKIDAAAAKTATASATKIPRHDRTDSAAANGSVDNRAPHPPATIIHPPRDAWRSREYHVAIALSGAIRHTDTPAPMSARA